VLLRSQQAGVDGDRAQAAAEDPIDPATWTWTAADLLFLDVIEAAHARGLRVLLDGVFNHTGRGFFAYRDLVDHGAASPFADWYDVERFDDPATPQNELRVRTWQGFDSLPELAETPDGTDLRPGPKAYILAATARWLAPEVEGQRRDGIDGWRLDVASDNPIGFWSDWNGLVHDLQAEAYTVAETWYGPRAWRADPSFLTAGGFDAAMNYDGVAYPVKGFFIDRTIDAAAFARELNTVRGAYPAATQRLLLNILDSHDTPRLASMIVNADLAARANDDHDYDRDASPRVDPTYDVRAPTPDERRLARIIRFFQMTYVGVPSIYYGSEAGMWGADDPDNRMPMWWPDLAFAPQAAHPLGLARPADAVAFDTKEYDALRQLLSLRASHPALRRGELWWLSARAGARAFAFGRFHPSESLLVAINAGDHRASLEIDPRLLPCAEPRVAFTTEGGPSDDAPWTLPPRSGRVLTCAE